MRPEIASLVDRMAEGGDWRQFQQEISALHEVATSEEERIALLKAHAVLRALAESVFDADMLPKVLDIAGREYKLFLWREALTDHGINPAELKRVTEREVRDGRMRPDDEFHTFAIAAGNVLGDSDEDIAHKCRNGDWLTLGAMGGAVLAVFLPTLGLSPWLAVLLGLVAGYLVNERERLRIKAEIARSKGV